MAWFACKNHPPTPSVFPAQGAAPAAGAGRCLGLPQQLRGPGELRRAGAAPGRRHKAGGLCGFFGHDRGEAAGAGQLGRSFFFPRDKNCEKSSIMGIYQTAQLR